MPLGTKLAAKQFLLVHLRTDGTNSQNDIYQSSGSSNMSNTSGSVALFSAEPRGKETIKSFMQWGRAGETWESSASDAGLWTKGAFVNTESFSEGSSLILKQDGVTNGGADAWSIASASTPKSKNSATVPATENSPTPSSSVSPSPTHSPTPSSAPSVASSQAFAKTIKAYAGEDAVAMVGVVIEFLGHAKGLNDEPIDSSARFFWNFGDGETREGRSVAHVYRIPGIYTASVHVSSGEYAASDVARIDVRPNKITLSEVISGTDGYIRLINNSDSEADIGGWIIRDGAQHNFFVPAHTILARRADIAIANSVSGLLPNAAAIPITIFYANGMQALASKEASTSNPSARVAVTIASFSPAPTPDVPRVVTILSSRTPSSLPSPAPSTAPSFAADTAYAASGYSPILFPFGIAAAISALGAAGFFVSKKYF